MRIPLHPSFCVAPLAIGFALTACTVDTSSVCIGVCGPSALQKSVWAVGFPQGRVDRTALGPSGYYRGRLPVGQSVTLYKIRAEVPGFPADTMRQVVWALGDSIAAGIQALPDGGVRLTGQVPGVVRQVLGDGIPLVVWSCPVNQGPCERLEEILITP